MMVSLWSALITFALARKAGADFSVAVAIGAAFAAIYYWAAARRNAWPLFAPSSPLEKGAFVAWGLSIALGQMGNATIWAALRIVASFTAVGLFAGTADIHLRDPFAAQPQSQPAPLPCTARSAPDR